MIGCENSDENFDILAIVLLIHFSNYILSVKRYFNTLKRSTFCTKHYAAQFSKMSSKTTLDCYKSIFDSLMTFLHQNDKKTGMEKMYL